MKTIKAISIPFDYINNLGDCKGLDVIKAKLNKANIELFETYIYCEEIGTNLCSPQIEHWCEPLWQWSHKKPFLCLTDEEFNILEEAIVDGYDANYYNINKEWDSKTLKTYTDKKANKIFENGFFDTMEACLLQDMKEKYLDDWIF